MRDHAPLIFDQFNGLWVRSPNDTVPKDHWGDCNNVTMLQTGFKTRDGINVYLPFANITRAYTYIKTSSQSLLALDTSGNIFDTGSPTPSIPILTIPQMTDFGFVAINGRAYISPSDGSKGLSGQSIYVYKGDGSVARLAGGSTPVNGGTPFAAVNGATTGNIESGTHIFAVVYETDTGFLSALGPVGLFPSVVAGGTKKVDLTFIPTSASASVVARRIVATRAIQDWNNNQYASTFYFVPGGRIADNVTTTLSVNFYDAELLSDASHLINNFSNIPAGVGLSVYRNRLVSWAENANPTLVRLSTANEPEAVDQVNGLLQSPIGSKQISFCQEYREVLYVFEQNKTYGYPDNGDDPTTWVPSVIDRGLGATIHGIATVLDSAGASVEFLMVLNNAGVYLFSGLFQDPELSWKIKDLWQSLSNLGSFQILVDSLKKVIYINLLNSTMLIGDFNNGLNAQAIKWTKWTFNIQTSTIALINTNQLIIGSSQQA